ncbi:unnamed protein product [Toxocara canis]|uniref:G-protein alpha subunit n=1 Tax=Toxocara canis TaxID=6265 RepID=A0A183UHZ0_TOXCA|nr:unnamed protein product [Toxocara canis]
MPQVVFEAVVDSQMGCTGSVQVSDYNGAAETKKPSAQKANDPAPPPPPPARRESDPKVEAMPATAEEEANEDNNTVRLLLLGAAESGKTTVLEQISSNLRKLYHQNFTEVELMHRRAFIFENIINSMRSMLSYLEQIKMPLADPDNPANAQLVKDELEGVFSKLNPRQYNALMSLWNDASIQEIYERRSEYNLNDSTKYFFDSLERINALDYTPTPQDLIMVYCPTVGVQNVIFTVHNRTYQLFDIGGQKIDRRKWASMYDGIDAIIFCIAISEYDQKMNEDGSTNRLHDALNLLEQICNEPKFHSTWVFIFLNEIDVLAEKISKVPIEKYFPEYNGKFFFLICCIILSCFPIRC